MHGASNYGWALRCCAALQPERYAHGQCCLNRSNEYSRTSCCATLASRVLSGPSSPHVKHSPLTTPPRVASRSLTPRPLIPQPLAPHHLNPHALTPHPLTNPLEPEAAVLASAAAPCLCSRNANSWPLLLCTSSATPSLCSNCTIESNPCEQANYISTMPSSLRASIPM